MNKPLITAGAALILIFTGIWATLFYLNETQFQTAPNAPKSTAAPIPEAAPYPIVPELQSRRHSPLGSSEYERGIQAIAAQYGAREAFAIITEDVTRYGPELDRCSESDLHRFHKLISTLVFRIGYVDQEMHYFRNKLNRAPATLTALIRYNAVHPVNKRWVLLSPVNSAYHLQGANGEFNLKFDSYDGYCEAVYNRHGTLLDERNDSVNMGTYNYSAGIPLPNAHTLYDVVPFLLYGNTPASPERGKAACSTGANHALQQYRLHTMDVYQYRKNLFGVQSGRVQ